MMRLALIAIAAVVVLAAQSELPEGENKKLVERICLDCHGQENFVKKRLDKDGWEKIVGDMITVGAKGTDEEFDKVVEYLAKNFGKDKR